MLLVPGSSVDRFVVVRLLGEGGLARVYLVKHRRLGSEHALKLLHVSGERARQRFLQEGQVQARIRHPNLVPVTDVVELEDEIGLVMDFVDGPSLAEVLAGEGAISRHDVPHLVDQMCRGVTAAHVSGVLHRDLKPANVLLEVNDAGITARISDFGIAKVLADFREGTPSLTEQGTFMGTLGYMAPEQLSDAKGVDARADVFSLGCIVYEMLAGHSPYLRRDRAATIQATLAGEHRPLGDAAPGLPPELVALVERAIHPLPGRRPDTVEHLRAALLRAAEHLQDPGGIDVSAAPVEAPVAPTPAPPTAVPAPGVAAPTMPVRAAAPTAAPATPTAVPVSSDAAASPPTAVPPGPTAVPPGPTAVPPGPVWDGLEKQAAAVDRGRLLDQTAAPRPETPKPRVDTGKPLLDFDRNRTRVGPWLVALGVMVSVGSAGVLWVGHDQAERIAAADARVATLAGNLARPWQEAPAPLAMSLAQAGGNLTQPLLDFRFAPTARERITKARALVRAVRGELAAQAKLRPTPEPRLALSLLEPIDSTVKEAEVALTTAESLRTEWGAAVAVTVGWLDPAVPAGAAALPTAPELPVFFSPIQ